MSDDIAAVHGIIRFLWHKIKEEEILDPDDYAGLTPIVPYHEVPALMQVMDLQEGIQQFPYIIYTWTTNGYGQNWFEPCDQAVFTISSHSDDKLRQLIKLMTNLFKRFDESAALIDYYIETGRCGRNCTALVPDVIPAKYKEYGYQYTEVLAATGGGAVMDENSPKEAMITMKIEYTQDRDNIPLNPPLAP